MRRKAKAGIPIMKLRRMARECCKDCKWKEPGCYKKGALYLVHVVDGDSHDGKATIRTSEAKIPESEKD